MKTSWLERGGFWDKGKKQAEKPELPVIREIPVESIRPNPAQPRLSYESGALEELAESIRENGLIQPVLVRQLLDGDYELIAGHRRWMAVRKLGQPTIRAIVENRTDTESAVLALVENIQRRDLDCMEEARAIAGLIESTGMTQQEAARRLGKSQPAVANKLRLLRLPGWVQEIVEEGQLSERHARALLRLEREEDLRRVLDQVRRRNLTVEQTEALVDDCLSAPERARHPHCPAPGLPALCQYPQPGCPDHGAGRYPGGTGEPGRGRICGMPHPGAQSPGLSSTGPGPACRRSPGGKTLISLSPGSSVRGIFMRDSPIVSHETSHTLRFSSRKIVIKG